MRCSDYEKRFSDYIEDALVREDREALRFHLNGCFRCRIKLEDMQRSLQVLHSLRRVNLRPEFDHALRQRIHTEITTELYARPFRARVMEVLQDIGQAAQQRSVQAVFAVSLLLTAAIGIMNAGRFETSSVVLTPPMQLALSGIPLPLPVPPEPAPAMFVSMKPADQILKSRNYARPVRVEITTDGMAAIETAASTAPNLDNPESLTPMLWPSQTTTASTPSIAFETANAAIPEDPSSALSLRLFDPQLDGRLNSSALPFNAFINAEPTRINGQQINRRYILPAVSSKQAARIIF